MSDDEPQPAPYATIIPSRAIFDRAVSPRMLQCLAVLCMHANRRGVCWPSRKRIAVLMGGDIGEDAVSHLIRRLQVAGYVQVAHRHDKAGRQQSNKYRVVLDGDIPRERDRYPYEDHSETTDDDTAETRANREQDKAATDKPQRSTQRPTTQRPAGRREQRQPDQPDALPVPGADVAPAAAGLVATTAPGDDARTGPAPDILTPDGRLTPEEQQRRERANLAELGLTDADAEEYRANPRDWRAAQGIQPRPRTGAGHTRPAAQPGRSTPRR